MSRLFGRARLYGDRMVWAELRADATVLLTSADPVARRFAAGVLDLIAPPLVPATGRYGGPPPPCPSCGRRFAASTRTGRQPRHGPRDTPCPGAGDPIPSEPAEQA